MACKNHANHRTEPYLQSLTSYRTTCRARQRAGVGRLMEQVCFLPEHLPHAKAHMMQRREGLNGPIRKNPNNTKKKQSKNRPLPEQCAPRKTLNPKPINLCTLKAGTASCACEECKLELIRYPSG